MLEGDSEVMGIETHAFGIIDPFERSLSRNLGVKQRVSYAAEKRPALEGCIAKLKTTVDGDFLEGGQVKTVSSEVQVRGEQVGPTPGPAQVRI
jgi:hypothetical protein